MRSLPTILVPLLVATALCGCGRPPEPPPRAAVASSGAATAAVSPIPPATSATSTAAPIATTAPTVAAATPIATAAPTAAATPTAATSSIATAAPTSTAAPKLSAAALRKQRKRRLQQVILAVHAYAEAHRKLPTDILAADGTPLLIWRVRLLPFLEGDDLFKQFKLDEPWDSPHNRPLVDKLPDVYLVPGTAPGSTSIFVFKGIGTAFPPKGDPLTFDQMQDGTSNTLFCVVAKPEKAVPWSRPSDLDYDPKRIAELVETLPEKEAYLAFFDGGADFLDRRPDATMLKAMITPNEADDPYGR